MKITKWSIAMVLCIVLIASIGTAAIASDTPSSWAVIEVNTAIAEGLVPQNLQSAYTQATTRAEFAALAVTLYEKEIGTIMGRVTFTDTNDVNVQKAAHVGVVLGVGNNRFDPNGKLTREQAATMLSRLSDAIGQPLLRRVAVFADNSSIASWALEHVGRVQAADVMRGVGNNRFAPQDPYTREQSILTILRMFNYLREAKNPLGVETPTFPEIVAPPVIETPVEITPIDPPPIPPSFTIIPGSGGTFRVNGKTEYSFTPDTSGRWRIYTSDSIGDPYLWLHDQRGNFMAENDDYEGNVDSLITYTLEAGRTYNITAGFYDSGTGSYTLNIELSTG